MTCLLSLSSVQSKFASPATSPGKGFVVNALMSDDMGIFSLAVPFADSVNQDFVHKMFYVVDCLGTLVIHGTSNSASATFMTIRLNPTAFDDISEEMREH